MRKQRSLRCGPIGAALAVALSLANAGVAAAQGSSPTQLRRFIDTQVGGIQKLMVPAHDTDLPQPRLANGSPTRNSKSPKRSGTSGSSSFTIRFGPPESCRSSAACPPPNRPGPAAAVTWASRRRRPARSSTSRSAAKGVATPTRPAISFRADGRGPTSSRSFARRPLFPGDALVDELPTLTDIYELAVGSPARGRKLPALVCCCEPVDSTRSTASRAMRPA